MYRVALPFYDKRNRLLKIADPAEIFIIGSSHVLWDIDPTLLSTETGKSVNLISPPGADMELRHAILSDAIRLHKNRLPHYLILETDKYSFDGKRYPEDVYKSLKAYYHQGILRNYLEEKISDPVDLFFLKVIKVYSMNGDFHIISTEMIDSLVDIILHRNRENINSSVPDEDPANGEDRRISWEKKWEPVYKKEYTTPGENSRLRNHFLAIVKLCKTNKIELVLLNTPNYRFLTAGLNTTDGPVPYFKELSAQNPHVHYMELNPYLFQNDISLLYDPSHLNKQGQILYTKALSEELRQM